jgi:hypothetical protein
MNLIKSIDLDYGKLREDELEGLIKKMWGDDLKKTKSKYNYFDYYGTNKYVELKSRCCKFTDYTDIMIGVNKVKMAGKYPDRLTVFVFEYTDGVWYWVYDELEANDIIIRDGGRKDRGKDETKPYAFIPKRYLKKI